MDEVVKRSPETCGCSKNLYGVWLCKDACARCPIVYRENGECVLSQVDKMINALRKAIEIAEGGNE